MTICTASGQLDWRDIFVTGVLLSSIIYPTIRALLKWFAIKIFWPIIKRWLVKTEREIAIFSHYLSEIAKAHNQPAPQITIESKSTEVIIG